MNQEELKQKIAEYYAKLPQEAQEVFSSMVWMEKLKEIESKYNLNNKQTEILATETTLVMLGITHLEEYVDILRKELGIDAMVLDKVLDEVDGGILGKIKGSLVGAFESNISSIVGEDTSSENLTEEEQVAIENSDWKQVISRINQNYKLNILQGKILEDTTLRVINNSIHIDKYKDELINKISISPEEANSIAEEVKEKIFNKIKKLAQIEKVARADFEKVPEPEYHDVPLPPYVKNIETKKEDDQVKIIKPSYDERKQPDPYHEEI